MINLQAAERCEPSGMIPELLTELPRPSIGLANVGVAMELGRYQGWTKRHSQVELTLRPLARIRQLGTDILHPERVLGAIPKFGHQRQAQPHRREGGGQCDTDCWLGAVREAPRS